MHQKTNHFERHTPATYEEEKKTIKERKGTVVRKVKEEKRNTSTKEYPGRSPDAIRIVL
jgi:hypothetical protein